MTVDLSMLPRVADGWTFLYAEHVRVEREQHAITLMDKQGRVPIPVASLSSLLLGPGSTLTHSAMMVLAENGCSVVWCGESGVRAYGMGFGETRKAHNLMAQAAAWGDPAQHLEVVRRMYRMRFPEDLPQGLTLEQLRGREGVRVRDRYAFYARETGVRWSGRLYKQGEWGRMDAVNRALSVANSCLYGLCHAAICATGFSPGLGFVHTGKMLAFVYDIADLYKCDVTVPVAFHAAREGEGVGFDRRVRRTCRDLFRQLKLIERIVPDIQRCLGMKEDVVSVHFHEGKSAEDPVGALWDPTGAVAGGVNYGDPVGGATVETVSTTTERTADATSTATATLPPRSRGSGKKGRRDPEIVAPPLPSEDTPDDDELLAQLEQDE